MTENQMARKYLDLIRLYTDGEIEAYDFMMEYLDEFKEDYHDKPADELYELLEPLFFAAEVYCDDPALRDENNIGETQFLKEAAYTRRKLEALLGDCDNIDFDE